MKPKRSTSRLYRVVGRAVEDEVIKALRECGGNVTATARTLGVTRPYLHVLIRKSKRVVAGYRQIKRAVT